MSHPIWTDPITNLALVVNFVALSILSVLWAFALAVGYKTIMWRFGRKTPMLDRIIGWPNGK